MLEQLRNIYEENSDITIMNCMYQYGRRDEDGKVLDDFIIIVYKDNSTGKKDHIIIKRPSYNFYMLKKEFENEIYSRSINKQGDVEIVPHNLLFIDKDKVNEIEVRYKFLEKEIAKLTDKEADYNDAIANGDKEAIRKLHADPRIFNSDQSIEDHYRLEFGKYYTNKITKLHKAFFDIETDIRHMIADFPDPATAECPINAISFMDEQANIEYSFLLRNNENPLIEKLENEYLDGKFTPKDIHNFVMNAVGGYKKMVKSGLYETQFRFFWFDSEIELLKSFFDTVYQFDPDFIEGWNSSGFDLDYIIHRIAVLGYDPSIIMSDPRWNFPYLKHYVDTRHKNDFAERGDYTNIACNPVWLDQMIQYCSRRKAKMGSFTSFKLDDIGELTAGVHKLDYSHITTNIGELPYLDYKTFVLYNVMDVIVQKCIEQKTNDLEYIFAKCIVNNTSYKKGHRQTVYLINRMNKEWDKIGYVIGNNVNKWNSEPDKFQGALVGDPLKTNDYSKLKIDGIPIMVCDNLDDFDFKSLYPSDMIEFNIAPNTQIGRIHIWNTFRSEFKIFRHPLIPRNRVPDEYNSLKEGEKYYIKDLGDGYNKINSSKADLNNIKEIFEDLEKHKGKSSESTIKARLKRTLDDFIKNYMNPIYTVDIYLDKEYKKFVTTVPFIPMDWFNVLLYEFVYDNENAYKNEKYSRSGEYIENFVTDNPIEFCRRWLHLAGFKEFLEDWDEYNKKYLTCYSNSGHYDSYIDNNGKLKIVPLIDLGPKKVSNPIIDLNKNQKQNPIFYYGSSKSYGVNLNDFRE